MSNLTDYIFWALVDDHMIDHPTASAEAPVIAAGLGELDPEYDKVRIDDAVAAHVNA